MNDGVVREEEAAREACLLSVELGYFISIEELDVDAKLAVRLRCLVGVRCDAICAYVVVGLHVLLVMRERNTEGSMSVHSVGSKTEREGLLELDALARHVQVESIVGVSTVHVSTGTSFPARHARG